MKTRIELLYAISLTLLLASCGEGSNNSGRAQIAIPVTIEAIEPNSLEQLTSTNGTLVPTESATITSLISGVYSPMKNPTTGELYKIGDKVKAGELLAVLKDEEYVNDVSIDTKRISLQIAEGELEKYKALHKKGGATEVEIRNAEVDVAEAKLTYENAVLALEQMNVRTPIGGVLVDLNYQTPNVKIDSGVEIFSVMNYSKMLLSVSLSESTMNYIECGLPVYVSHYSMPDLVLNAKIDQLSPSIDTSTRTYKGVIMVNNRDLVLKPGMFVKSDIVVERVEGAVIIPKEIIRNISGRSTVFTADGTTAIQRSIVTGIEDDNYVEVVRGLEIGDKLVVEGYQTLRHRAKIAIE